ncbi:YqgU-like beta propeller domain-containing protein [Niallia nealsonii]|uniref:YqgU-like 6-bladed beta-propeller domain-containing protein n=1 Tax=Niallia nealsonii TaxID=115979 RepID=A0A2N0Z8A1_9BACI|nr:hypothetical protein [Niallia nealsonii]PKG25723.1 hypothetical protein CWS01_00395 [Niallia nealsonii]
MSCLIRGKSAYLVFLCFLFTLALVGCTDKQKNIKNNKEEKDAVQGEQTKKTIFPINDRNGDFIQVAGWLSNESIAYIAKKGTSYQLYKHQLLTGKDTLLYQSNQEIVTVEISPDLQKALIYTNSLKGGEITVIDSSGSVLYTSALASFEAEFVWNPFTNNELVVTAFKEDWSSNVFLLKVNDQKLIEEAAITPFSQWLNKEELAYINWQEQDSAFQSPLKTINLQTKVESVHSLPKSYSFYAAKEAIVTISTNEEKKEQALYTFYNHQFQKYTTVSMPRLAKFNDWFVPYFTINNDKFYTFVPKENGDIETYKKGFAFVSFDIKNGLQKNIGKKLLENEPISLSPNGQWCLYGYYFEKLMNVDTGEIQSLSGKNNES